MGGIIICLVSKLILHTPQPGQKPRELDPEFLRSPSPNHSLVPEEEELGRWDGEEEPGDLEDIREEVTMDLTTEEANCKSPVTSFIPPPLFLKQNFRLKLCMLQQD